MPDSPRRIRLLQGAANFRDLGGYASANGQVLRWRQLFRSELLQDLSEQDWRALQSLGIGRSLDLRAAAERAAQPMLLPGIATYALPIEPAVVRGLQALLATGQQPTAAQTQALMQETYRAFVHDEAPRFAALFAHLLESEAPVMFHCTAGKDRTGFAAALILLALQVPRPVVMQDYLLTNHLYQPPKHLRQGPLPPESQHVLWRVQPDFLQAALAAIDQQAGGLPRYLAQQLGLGPAALDKLRQKYLQNP